MARGALQHALGYLGQLYPSRSNRRLLELEDGQVSFLGKITATGSSKR